ncbi:MAG: hypothetical protein DMD38_04000 [Gemmatimonadetes bacterium]|nr:MAG: hypothetical protein AUI86_06445 [Gemmatimonadetes bacterium 13_1_40CM_3_66_12]PYP97651.1 MAG: hypothetical protein DMD38_04000 [Gemmatimonadota bacterium]
MAASDSGPDSGPVFPLAPPPPGQGPGWAKLAAAVEAQVPPAEIETIYVFRPIKRQGREWGTAVITRRSEADRRLRVYTAKYMLIVRGKDRGQSKIEVVEVALSPADVLAQVMQATVDRGGDTEPPVELGPAVWYEGR